MVSPNFITTTNPKNLLVSYPDAYALLGEYKRKREFTFYMELGILYALHYTGVKYSWTGNDWKQK